MDNRHWPRCLLWHVWLPALSGRCFGIPWPPHLMTSHFTNLSGYWGLTQIIFLCSGMLMMITMLRMLHVLFLLLLILGQMVVWLRMTSPKFVLLALGCRPNTLLMFGRAGGPLDDVGTQECRLYREPKSEVLVLLRKLVLLFISVVTILMLFDIVVRS